jgi:hypothetical protein
MASPYRDAINIHLYATISESRFSKGLLTRQNSYYQNNGIPILEMPLTNFISADF